MLEIGVKRCLRVWEMSTYDVTYLGKKRDRGVKSGSLYSAVHWPRVGVARGDAGEWR